VASLHNNFVYVVDAETPKGTSPIGEILGFSQNTTTGALTALPGVTITSNLASVTGVPTATGYTAGVTPSGIAENPLSTFVYVTDKASNQLIGYVVQANGSLVPMVNGPFTTGQFPWSLTIDPRGSFLYVVNYNASTVGAYSIDTSTGTPTATAGTGGSTQVSTNPVAITIEPALGIYLYTANQTDGTISGEQLSPNNGSLTSVQNGLASTSTSVTTPTN
jgi:6-phosphogluconolactonase (cycloisomerase 2 family)